MHQNYYFFDDEVDYVLNAQINRGKRDKNK